MDISGDGTEDSHCESSGDSQNQHDFNDREAKTMTRLLHSFIIHEHFRFYHKLKKKTTVKLKVG